MVVLVNQLTIIICLPYLTSSLGFETFGILTKALIIYQISTVIMEFGCSYSSIYFVKGDEEKNIKLEDIILPIFTIRLIIYLIILSIIYVFSFILNLLNFSSSFFIFMGITIFLAGNNPNWIYQVKLKNFHLLISTLFARIIFLVLVFTCIENSSNLDWYFIALSICFFIVNFYAFFYFRKLKLTLRGYKFFFKIIQKSFTYFISSVLNFHLNSLWALTLLAFGTNSQIIFFNLADQCYRALNGLSGSIPANLYSKYTKKSDFPNAIKLGILISFLLIITYIVVYLFIDEVVIFFFDEIYHNVTLFIKIYIVGSLFLGLIGIFGFPLLGLLTNASRVKKIILLSGSLNLLFLFLWIFFLPHSVLNIVLIHLIINIFIFLLQGLIILMNLKKVNFS